MAAGYRVVAEAVSVRSLCLEALPKGESAFTAPLFGACTSGPVGAHPLRTCLAQLEKNIPLKPLRRYLCPPRSPHAGP